MTSVKWLGNPCFPAGAVPILSLWFGVALDGESAPAANLRPPSKSLAFLVFYKSKSWQDSLWKLFVCLILIFSVWQLTFAVASYTAKDMNWNGSQMNFKEGFSMTAGKQSCCLAQCQALCDFSHFWTIFGSTQGHRNAYHDLANKWAEQQDYEPQFGNNLISITDAKARPAEMV